jgi:hypothetical protein
LKKSFFSKILVSESLSIVKLNNKDDLMEKVDNLRTLVKRNIEKFESEGKQLLVGGLVKLDKEIFDIKVRLINCNLESDVGQIIVDNLVESLKNAETGLEAEVKILTASSVKH